MYLLISINSNIGSVSTTTGNDMIVSDGKLIVSKTIETYIIIVELIDTFGKISYTPPNIK